MNGRTPYGSFLDRIPANDNSQEDTAHQTDQATAAGPTLGTVSVHAVWAYLSFPTTPPGLMASALHKGLSGECRFRYSFVHAYNFTDGEVQCPLRLRNNGR